MADELCSIAGCDRPRDSRGWCSLHYFRWYKHGDPLKTLRVRGATTDERFWVKVDKTATCWLWTASVVDGYGSFYNGKRTMGAHRWSYERFVGPVPTGFEVDHLCRTPACVRPSHLEAVPKAENMRRSRWGTHNRDKTHCKNGHPFDEANTTRLASGRRQCRACGREASRRAKARKKAA